MVVLRATQGQALRQAVAVGKRGAREGTQRGNPEREPRAGPDKQQQVKLGRASASAALPGAHGSPPRCPRAAPLQRRRAATLVSPEYRQLLAACHRPSAAAHTAGGPLSDGPSLTCEVSVEGQGLQRVEASLGLRCCLRGRLWAGHWAGASKSPGVKALPGVDQKPGAERPER